MNRIKHCEFCNQLDEIDEVDDRWYAHVIAIRTADIVEKTLCWRKRQQLEETGEATCEGCEKPDCILNIHTY